MKCFIYRATRKQETYIYLPSKDQFDHLPENLLALLGRLEFAMELDLASINTLANADLEDVKMKVRSEGYYLQLPPEQHIWT
ncbi:MAG: YcgL domain-containing protein [Candidatus Thioglobus sp.]|nr:MAG: YcgL domain-containing protein [Candidatus Thioglobus sp.]